MIQVTILEEKDIEQVLELERICFPDDPWGRALFEHELTNPLSVFLVARDMGTRQVIGYGGIWLIYDTGEITNIAVHPDYRREGVGSEILAVLTQICMEKGMDAITLEVRESNQAAQNLYASKGFLVCGRRKRYYQGKEDALIMTKELRKEEK